MNPSRSARGTDPIKLRRKTHDCNQEIQTICQLEEGESRCDLVASAARAEMKFKLGSEEAELKKHNGYINIVRSSNAQ